MDLGKIVSDIIRSILWMFTSFALTIMDIVYDVVEKLIVLDLTDVGWIWDWFKLLCIFLSAFILFRVAAQFFKMLIDEEFRDRYDPVKLIARVGIIAIVTASVPLILPPVSSASSSFVENITTTLGIESTKPSGIVVAAGNNGQETTLDYTRIDINATSNDEYIYFPGNTDILIALIGSIGCCFVFVMIAIQIAQRFIGFILTVLIGPYPISGIVSEGDGSFSTWIRMLISYLLLNYVQLLLVYATLTAVNGITFSQDLTGALAKLLLLIGGLYAVMNAPSNIGSLIGGDIGLSSAMQNMSNVSMMGHTLGAAASLVGGAVAGASARAGYIGGRALGGASVAELASNASANAGYSGSGMGGGASGSSGGSASGSSTPNTSSGNGSSGSNSGYVGPSTQGGSTGGGHAFNGVASALQSPGGAGGYGSGGTTKRKVDHSVSPGSKTRNNTIANAMGQSLSRSPTGRVVNAGAGMMYQAAANRVSKAPDYKHLHNTKENIKSFYHSARGDV